MKKIYLLLFLFASETSFAQKFLEGFKIMDLPRQDINLGAEWISGVGPNGDGTTADNIIANKSISEYELDKDFKSRLNLALFNFLNLGAEYAKSTTINFKNLKVYTVKDFSKLSIRSEQSILYEGIKADSIFIKIDKELDANLSVKLSETLKEVDANISGSLQKGVKVAGDKLFLAYRVFTLGKTSSKKSVKKIGTSNGGFNEIEIKDYIISINNSRIRQCLFKDKKVANETDPAIIDNCLKNNTIYLGIKSFSDVSINGRPLTVEKEIHNAVRTTFSFTKRANSSLLSDHIEVDYVLDVSPKYGITIFMAVNSVSKVTLVRTETKLKVVKNPQAGGW